MEPKQQSGTKTTICHQQRRREVSYLQPSTSPSDHWQDCRSNSPFHSKRSTIMTNSVNTDFIFFFYYSFSFFVCLYIHIPSKMSQVLCIFKHDISNLKSILSNCIFVDLYVGYDRACKDGFTTVRAGLLRSFMSYIGNQRSYKTSI